MRARKFAALSAQDEDRVDTIGSRGTLLLFSIEANWPALMYMMSSVILTEGTALYTV